MNLNYGFLLLANYYDKNNFDQTDSLTITKGNPATIYFRLVTIRQSPLQTNQGSNGFQTFTSQSIDFDLWRDTLRYLPPAGTTITCSFSSIDDDSAITNRPATQVIPGDHGDDSIWSVPILAGETFAPNTMSIQYNDGTNTYNVQALSDIGQLDTSSTDRFYC